jgi:hypothetical protein
MVTYSLKCGRLLLQPDKKTKNNFMGKKIGAMRQGMAVSFLQRSLP